MVLAVSEAEVEAGLGGPRWELLSDPESLQRVAFHVYEGGAAVGNFGGVYGVLVRGDIPEAVQLTRDLKGIKEEKPLSALVPPEYFFEVIDHDQVPPRLRHTVNSPQALIDYYGGLFHVGATMRRDMVERVPRSMVRFDSDGRLYFQNLIAHGLGLIEHLAQALYSLGAVDLAISSLNKSKEMPEIIGQKRVIDYLGSFSLRNGDESEIVMGAHVDPFFAERGMSLVLFDDPTPRHPSLFGSKGIFDLNEEKMVRPGDVHQKHWLNLLEVPLDIDMDEKPHYPQANFVVAEDSVGPPVRVELLRQMFPRE